VNQSWAQSTGNIKLDLPENPIGHTILTLHIPITDIDPQYWDYLGDDEAEVGASGHNIAADRS
jgi:hypothetical protein